MAANDPIAAATRRSKASRKVARGAACPCGEKRAAALVPGAIPVTCAECRRIAQGKSRLDQHHVAGRANHEFTVPIPANDHRAVLSEQQYDWPKDTLRNPNQSPLRAAAACIRGFIETIRNMMDDILEWIPALLEWLDEVLTAQRGPKWWMDFGTRLGEASHE